MNKLFTKIAGIALGLTMAVGVGVAVSSEKTAKEVNAAITEPDVTYTFSEHYSANTKVDDTTISLDEFTIATFAKRSGGTDTQYYTNGSAVRWYGGGTLAIASSKSLVAIDITFTQTANSVSANVGNYSLSSSVGSWTGNTNSVTFSQSGTSGQCRISAISLKYDSGTDKTPVSLTLGGTYKTVFGVGDAFTHEGMTVTVNYDDDTSLDVTAGATWSSPDMSTTGQKTVTVSYEENETEVSEDYSITVKGVDHIAISGQTISFDQGDTFVFGGTVTAYYTDNTNADVTSEATFTGYDMSTTGNQTVTVSYGGQSTTYEITIKEAASITFTAGVDKSGAGVNYVSKGGVTMEYESGHGDFNRDDNYRVYSGYSFSITSAGANIDSITFTFTGTGNDGGLDSVYYPAAKSWEGKATGEQVRMTKVVVAFENTTPSASLAPSSATSVSMLKGDSDTSIKVLVKNIENPEWVFTFDEDEETGLTTSTYVNVAASELDSNDISTLTITTKANGSTVLHIAVSSVVCESAVDITVSPKPQAGTMVAKLGGEVVTGAVECKTGEHVQFTFAAEDTDGNAYAIAATALKATIVSGDAYGSLYGSTGVNGTAPGTVIARYALKVLESVYVDVTVNVLDDYLESVILETFAFNENLTATQGESPTEAVFSVRNGLTHFGETQVIPFEDFRFSYTDEMGVIGNQFSYDFSHGEVYDATHKDQTIYVYCTLGNVKVGTYSVRVEQLDDPLTAITLTNVTEHAKSIDLGGSFQLEWSYTPTNPTDGKEVVFRLENETEGSEISVNETGLISAGKVAGATAMVIVESAHDDTIYDYVTVSVAMPEMTYKVNGGEEALVPVNTVNVGEKVIIVGYCGKAEKTYELTGVNTSGTTNYGTATEYSDEPSATYVLDVVAGAGDNQIAFKTSDDKYLAYQAGKNGLTLLNSVTSFSSWYFNDNSLIANGEEGRFLYLNYNNGTPRFSSYVDKTSTTDKDNFNVPTFFKVANETTMGVTEDLYNAIYMNFGTGKTFTCDGDGKSFDATKWANAGAAITGLADFEDYMLNKAIANEDGNMVENFLAMYDYVIAKKEAGNKIYAGATDFLGRFEANGINHQVALTLRAESAAASDSTIKIIIIISLVSLTATLGCVLIRKRRTDR